MSSSRSARTTRGSWLSGDMRKAAGSLTTWENTQGQTLTVHGRGRLKDALPAVIADVLARDPSFRLVAYSTPDTILTDLDSRRGDFIKATGHTSRVRLPEIAALSRVGRTELLHPRLRVATEASVRRMTVPE